MSAYGKWMNRWENQLAFRSTNRVVRPFDWGLEWTRDWPCARLHPRNGHGPEEYLEVLNEAAMRDSDQFFDYRPPSDFALKDRILRFTSAIESPYPENNTVHAQWFPAKRKSKSAVVLLPHWNARAEQHAGLAKGISALGISVLRISLPYHDYRMPAELERADYAVSSNVGRTIDATRQAVIDVRSCYDWLERQGYEKLGIVGTSLGSCYAFLASAHDDRIKVNVFNHCSTYVADVVWTGLSTRHIREGLESEIDLERLRKAWLAISPPTYAAKFSEMQKKSLIIYANYDTTFLPEYSAQVMAAARELKWDLKAVVLPCGHYTLGEFPFKFIDGYHICSFLKRWM